MSAADDAANKDEASLTAATKPPGISPVHTSRSPILKGAAVDAPQTSIEHVDNPQTPEKGGSGKANNSNADVGKKNGDDQRDDNDIEDEEEADDNEEEDDEPQLKYDKISGRLASIYRNGDSSSALTIAGNKLVVGTDNGSVHVLALPSFTPLRSYRPHTASILSCSISPPYPSLAHRAHKESHNASVEAQAPVNATKSTPTTANAKAGRNTASQPHLTNTPDNAIYIATSSLDGNVCVLSLLDPKDVLVRNFARPVNAVALSPEYKSDRTYLSGGKAGQLVVTKGGKAGVRTDANTGSASAAASGWLSSIGLASDTGKDSVLHQGEGVISTIKWSRSGKWVVWVNEEGVKIMRSHIKLGSEESEYAWRRIAHAPKPERRIWEEMAGVWKAKAQWFDEAFLETDPASHEATNGAHDSPAASPSKAKLGRVKSVDKLVVGWGDTAWVMHVQERVLKSGGQNSGKMPIGNAEIMHKLYFQDCIVSGVALYTPTFAAILAYRTRDDNDRPISPSANRDKDTPRKGRAHRRTGLAPQLRLVDVRNGEELDVDELPMSRFQTLSAQDYTMESLWVPPLPAERTSKDSKGTLESLWEVSGGHYAQKLLSSGASVLSRSSSGFEDSARRGSFMGRSGLNPVDNRSLQATDKSSSPAHQYLTQPGLKLFIQSPYDCVLAVKRQASDHLEWLLSHQLYSKAWSLVDEQPELAMNNTAVDDAISISSGKTGRQAQGQSLADFLAGDESASVSSKQDLTSSATSEKQRIGDLWLAQLVASKDWKHAGEVAGKVLADGRRWDHWIKIFSDANQLDGITPYVPSHAMHPVIPSRAYEVILNHYIQKSPARACELLDEWEDGLFDAANVATTVKERVTDSSVTEGSEDWRWLLEALARLNLSLANPREALECYIRTQNAESAFRLIQEEKLADALGDDVPGFVTLKVSKKQLRNATLAELDEASDRAVRILVEEAYKSTVYPDTVIRQLQQKGPAFRPFLYFYLRTLWRGVDIEKAQQMSRRLFNRATLEGHAMVEDHADLAVELFAEYDRSLLMEFLEASEVYDYNRAATLCEQKHYTQELVLVLNRTGQTKRALWLIIGELGDASQAIAFVKQNPDLWDDLLEYGMDKPAFIRGLLAEVGTSIDPVKVVRNIPEGLEIDGLKEGILSLVQGWEVQLEVSRGVDRVLHGEVMAGMETLRKGQRQAVRFEVTHETPSDVELKVMPPPLDAVPGAESFVPLPHKHVEAKPGHCVGCGELFHENETETLLGFACGHVYHLSCLLRADDKTDPKQYESLMQSIGSGNGDTDAEHDRTYTRSVGVKVAHAHIIRNVVRSGCPHCAQALD